jgi:type I restriction enzyme, S subunit
MIWSTDDLDAHWHTVPLASIASKVGSGATPRGGRASYPDHGVPLIRSQNVHFDGFSTEGLAFLNMDQARQLDGATVNENDVLLNITGASIGRVCVAPPTMQGARVNQHVCIIRTDGVRPSFLAAYLSSPQIQDSIAMGNYGATREALTKSQILELPIPVPAALVQERLTRLVDSARQKRSSALAHIAVARQQVDRFRQAVLAAACAGRLTEDWREEHGEGSHSLVPELRDRSARRGKQVSEPRPDLAIDHPPGWDVVALDLLIDHIEAGKSFTALGRPATVDEWGVVKVSAMSWGSFREDENKAVPENRLINPDYEIRTGDLLLSRANTEDLVGATVLVGETRPRLLLSDKSLRLVTRVGIDKSWLNYMLRSPVVRSQLSERATGTSDSMRNLSQAKILATTLPLPPTKEQREIGRRVDHLLRLADDFMRRLNISQRRVGRSAQAVLAKAFRGELGPHSERVRLESGHRDTAI